MAKLNIKKAFSEVSKKVKEIDYQGIGHQIKNACEDFDVNQTLNTAGEFIKNTSKDELKEELKQFGQYVVRASKDASDKIHDVMDDISESIALETAVKVIYLAMNLDEEVDENAFKEYYQSTKLDETMYLSIINDCQKILNKATAYNEYNNSLQEGALFLLMDDYYSSLFINKLEFLKQLITMARHKTTIKQFYNAVARALDVDVNQASEIFNEASQY